MGLFHIHDPQVHAQKRQFDWGAHLGSGSFGEVSKCHWKEHDPPVDVAIKVVPKTLVLSKTRQEHTMDTLKELHHPHIINLIDWFQSREHYYVLFELAEGGELFDRIMEAGSFPEAPVATMMHDILRGIAYIHSHHFVHRDLKPENFLLRGKTAEPPFDVVVADFGVSHEMEEEGEVLRAICGSPGYTAPEVYARTGYGKPVDLWSCGVIAFVQLAGRFPYKYLEGQAFLDEVAREESLGGVYFPRTPWQGISEECKDFIRRCLTRDPQARITAQQALEHPWIKNAAPNPNAVTPIPIKPLLPSQKRRHTPTPPDTPEGPAHHSKKSFSLLSHFHVRGHSPASTPNLSRQASPPSPQDTTSPASTKVDSTETEAGKDEDAVSVLDRKDVPEPTRRDGRLEAATDGGRTPFNSVSAGSAAPTTNSSSSYKPSPLGTTSTTAGTKVNEDEMEKLAGKLQRVTTVSEHGRTGV